MFWGEVASALADHPAVLMFDLMNEPVLHTGSATLTCWLGGVGLTGPGCGESFGGMWFVQRLNRQPIVAPATPASTANQWLTQMTGAIRSVDPDRLITLGCVPDVTCLHLTPAQLATHLDVLSVHVYPIDCTPEGGQSTGLTCAWWEDGPEPTGQPLHFEHMVASTYHAAGKPYVVEETFSLQGSPGLVEQYIGEALAADNVNGWFGQWEDGTFLSDQRVSLFPSEDPPIAGWTDYPWYHWGRLFMDLTVDVAPCGGC
jgi:hypothetical protein